MCNSAKRWRMWFWFSVVAVLLGSRVAQAQVIEADFDLSRLVPFGAPLARVATDSVAGAFPLLSQPSSFDLRNVGGVNYVSPVKNQGACGSCWAFASIAPLESSILIQTGGTVTRDFSENHLIHYHGFDPGPCAGGNAWMSQAYFSRGSGPINESDDPYPPPSGPFNPGPGGPVQGYVRTSLYLDTMSEIKNEMMNRGAMYTSMYWDSGAYNSSDATYYYSGSGTNHGVTLVGWDDNKVVTGGGGAPGLGAWLVKNSWGTGFGQGGYFWMSYHDTQGGKYGVTFEGFQDANAAGAFNNVYYHDEFGYVGTFSAPYAFNAFTATADEDLAAVQFWTTEDGVSYDLRIYDDYSGGSLANLLASTTGTLQYEGYHTIDLPSSVALTNGDDFYVYLHLTNPTYGYPQAIDVAYSGYNSSSTANPGESYFSVNGTSWTDLTDWNSTANFAIKGLTIQQQQQATIAVTDSHGTWTVNSWQFDGNETLDIDKTANDMGPFDVEIQVTGNLTSIVIDDPVLNNSGQEWPGYRFQLGYWLNDEFVASTDGDGLAFDPVASNHISDVFSNVTLLSEDELYFSGGLVGLDGSVSFLLNIDLPGGSPFDFALRQWAVPEPGSAALLAFAVLTLLAFGRRRPLRKGA